jgi:hypothetical protein
MFKEVMNDLWLTRISSLSNEVGLYVVLLEVLLFMPPDYRFDIFKLFFNCDGQQFHQYKKMNNNLSA